VGGAGRRPSHGAGKEAVINVVDIVKRFRSSARPERALTRPRLAAGVELIGEYKGSGFREAPFLVRRGDGQVIQISRLLFLVAAAADGERDLAEIAAAVGAEIEQPLSPDNIAFLVDEKLRPVGLIGGEDDTSLPLPRAAAPLAFTARRAVVPASVVQRLAFWFQPLFWPIVQGILVGWLVIVDGWLFFHHGFSAGVAQLLARPALLLGLFALVVASTIFHELGHAAACRYSGARPGAMGIGLYLVWPAVFTDVTDAYRLDRAGRLRTDLGGVYFNGVFALGAFVVYRRTGFEPLLALILVEHLLMLQQLAPWVRLDGYYVLTDLVGVPDILSRIKPLLASLVPGRPASPRVTELKPWVRVAATAYVVTLVPILACAYVLLLVHTPRMFPRAAHSLASVWHRLELAVGAGRWVDVALDAVQLLAIALPMLGVAFVLLKTARALARRLAAPLRLAALFAAGIAAALLVGRSSTTDHAAVARADARPPVAGRHTGDGRARVAPTAAPAAPAVVERPPVGTTTSFARRGGAAPMRAATSTARSAPVRRSGTAATTAAAPPETTTRAATASTPATTRQATTTGTTTSTSTSTDPGTTTTPTPTEPTTTLPGATTEATTTTTP
jgi:putative peptide zinc metalloprotease protein